MRWILKVWHKRQRAIDVQILWPSCRDQAPYLDAARVAFAYHAFNDAAWLELGNEEIMRRISALT